MTKTKYTPADEDALLNLVLRAQATIPSRQRIAEAIGADPEGNGADSLMWKLRTGHDGSGKDETGKVPRRPYEPTPAREDRRGATWLEWECQWLLDAFQGEGKERRPPVSVQYMAKILMRDPQEIRDKWPEVAMPRGSGFGLARLKPLPEE